MLQIEKRLWDAADTLRANSNYASNEYFLPVMGLVFLRHAYSRYLAIKQDLTPNLPTRGGKPRALTKEDFARKSALFLQSKAQFDYLVALPDRADRAQAIIDAMHSIEQDYASLQGVLPQQEYQELNNDTLGQLLRILNPDELKHLSGDVFGRIYEYFLTKFADQKAHDGGEFFTPKSLVTLIASVLNPTRGTVLDPACGSGGMFVQSARIVENHGHSAAEKLTFRGLEKNNTTIRLAKMNLAVHGLEGDIKKAITYYEDPHELVGKANYVMANPPFNVDEIDANKIKGDPRLPFGLPGVNKQGKVTNGNYIWLSYFWTYLSHDGRAGFVMSSQASSASGSEAIVRQKLVETGDVDIMIAIRANFFYTRSVPCELWFFNRDKPKAQRDKVLMLDARAIYREETRKIYTFSPEQQQNLLAIVWLYRGQTKHYLALLADYCARSHASATHCYGNPAHAATQPLPDFIAAADTWQDSIQTFIQTAADKTVRKAFEQYRDHRAALAAASTAFHTATQRQPQPKPDPSAASCQQTLARLAPLTAASRALIESIETLYKDAAQVIAAAEHGQAKQHPAWHNKHVTQAHKALGRARQTAVEHLEQVHYFWQQAKWLDARFPAATLRDVPGLVKLVDHSEIAANDWSLTPGRYVGTAPAQTDADFDFAATLHTLHTELDTLNRQATALAAKIKKNFQQLAP